MKKLVSLLAVGALSVGFAGEGALIEKTSTSDAKDYLNETHSSKINVIFIKKLHLRGGEKVPNIDALLQFWSNVNDDPGRYLTKDGENYDSYAEAIVQDYVYLNSTACEELGKIMSKMPKNKKVMDILVFEHSDLSDIISGQDYDDNDNPTKWKCYKF